MILREHFRCAPEIIEYSNTEFYDRNLVPLRLPTSEERLNPSLLDVYLEKGKKTGKVNPEECDEIVRMIQEYVESCVLVKKRTIGVISLVGDEQSRLIRGRLLDRIGPHKFKLHDILVGEPPSFQGAERDIVFLSLVCSPGSVVTQNQLMHAQRINVALSRARDRMVLVRSIQSHHIPNEQDIKFSVLDFFERSRLEEGTKGDEGDNTGPGDNDFGTRSSLSLFRSRSERLLRKFLNAHGYYTRSMGVVWEDAICVEDVKNNASRGAICIEATGETHEEWTGLYEQQKSIERVGWKCLRVDGSAFLSNHARVLADVQRFLLSVGVKPMKAPLAAENPISQENMDIVVAEEGPSHDDAALNEDDAVPEEVDQEEAEAIVVVSSDDEGDKKRKAEESYPLDEEAASLSAGLGNGEKASDYGNIAGLAFLHRAAPSIPSATSLTASSVARAGGILTLYDDYDLDEGRGESGISRQKSRDSKDSDPKPRDLEGSDDDETSFDGGTTGDPGENPTRRSTRRKRLRQDKYSRDARWHPSHGSRERDVPYEEYIDEVIPEQDANEEAVMKNNEQEPVEDDDVHDDGSDSYVDEQAPTKEKER